MGFEYYNKRHVYAKCLYLVRNSAKNGKFLTFLSLTILLLFFNIVFGICPKEYCKR